MRRPRRNKEKKGGMSFAGSQSSPTIKAQIGASLAEEAIGRKIPDHELSVLGFGNVTRYFDLDEPLNGPSVVFRRMLPYAAFCRGYSNVDSTGASQDETAAVSTATSDPTTALYPVTRMAWDFQTDVWPVLSNLFSSGTGTRSTVSINEFIRYQAMLLTAYSEALTPVIINHLVYHFDWTQIAPFSGVVPKFLYDLADNLDATDVGLAETWLPILKRFDTKIAFPHMIAEVKRMLTPMLSIDLHGRLMIPLNFDPSTITTAGLAPLIIELLDYIDVNISSASAVFTSFLPFPMSEMDPWGFTPAPAIDVDRDSGWFNSGVDLTATFGDTGDPTIDQHMVCDEAAGDTCILYSRHMQPIWSEVKMSSIFRLTDDVTDDEFQLITPHKYYSAILIDDSFDSFAYDGTQILAASIGFRYLEFINCRFASTDVDYGTHKPGMTGTELAYNPLVRLMRIETGYVWSLTVLKAITTQMAGSSIRELRYALKQAVYEGVRIGL
jgi:hypothetical protein